MSISSDFLFVKHVMEVFCFCIVLLLLALVVIHCLCCSSGNLMCHHIVIPVTAFIRVADIPGLFCSTGHMSKAFFCCISLYAVQLATVTILCVNT